MLMRDYFEFHGTQFGIRVKVRYTDNRGVERQGTVVGFEEDRFWGEMILIAQYNPYSKQYEKVEMKLKEFEKLALIGVTDVDYALDIDNFLKMNSPEELEKQRQAQLAQLIKERQETKKATQQILASIEKEKQAQKADIFWILMMWVCIILAFVTGISAIAAGAEFWAACCFLGFSIAGLGCESCFSDSLQSQIQRNNKAAENKRLYGGYKCPNCGQKTGHPIGAVSKGVSIGAFGLASDKIGKTYKCERCGYMW